MPGTVRAAALDDTDPLEEAGHPQSNFLRRLSRYPDDSHSLVEVKPNADPDILLTMLAEVQIRISETVQNDDQ